MLRPEFLLDLQISTHSNLSTLFFEILAFFWKIGLFSHSASCHNAVFPGHTENPCPSCTVSLCEAGAYHTFTENPVGFRNLTMITGGLSASKVTLFFR
jgi:hypothetical protein